MKKNKNLGIIGTGGFAREVLNLAQHINEKSINNRFDNISFIELDAYYTKSDVDNVNVSKLSECDFKNTEFVIGIGDPLIRSKVLKELPQEMEFTSLISPLAFIANDVKFQQGLIVMPFSYISCNASLGAHNHINSHCVVGHDSVLGDYFTSAHSVMIAGNNKIDDFCYFGMNASTRQGVNICKNVIVGLNSGVVKDIIEPGTYVGTPAKALSK